MAGEDCVGDAVQNVQLGHPPRIARDVVACGAVAVDRSSHQIVVKHVSRPMPGAIGGRGGLPAVARETVRLGRIAFPGRSPHPGEAVSPTDLRT